MDLSYGPEYEAFRTEVCDFLKANWRKQEGDRMARVAFEADFRKKATDAGYVNRHVARRYGGSEQPPDVLKARILEEEFARAGAPLHIAGGIGVGLVVPTLLEHGTDWQKDHFIPKTLTGEYLWSQGYSEPGAGSDLASVRTRAELVDGRWVINGQKVWSSNAHRSRFMFMLVRTEPDAPRHKNLSYLLVDLKQPGITIRPLKQMTGWTEFCEVFFDNATTPAEWLVGLPGEGWAVSKSTLKAERNHLGGADRYHDTFNKLVKLAKARTVDGKPAIQDPVMRQRLARVAGSLAAQTYTGYRQMTAAAAGEEAGFTHLLSKLYTTNLGQEMAAIARDLIQEDLMLAPPAETEWRKAGDEKWNNWFMRSLGAAIAGGTSNIQRNIIASRALGLESSTSRSA